MVTAREVLADIQRWDDRYNGYVRRTDDVVDAWEIMKKVRALLVERNENITGCGGCGSRDVSLTFTYRQGRWDWLCDRCHDSLNIGRP